MKKFIMALVCLMTMVVLTSCGTKYIVTANYDVCYPDGTRAYNGTTIVRSSTEPYVSCYSYNGTNYVSVIKTDVEISNYSVGYGKSTINTINAKTIEKTEHFSSSTAPMRLNSYNVEKVKKGRKYIEDIYMKDIIGH